MKQTIIDTRWEFVEFPSSSDTCIGPNLGGPTHPWIDNSDVPRVFGPGGSFLVYQDCPIQHNVGPRVRIGPVFPVYEHIVNNVTVLRTYFYLDAPPGGPVGVLTLAVNWMTGVTWFVSHSSERTIATDMVEQPMGADAYPTDDTATATANGPIPNRDDWVIIPCQQ